MDSVLLPKEAIEELEKTNELLSYVVATCEILQGHIADISKLLQNQKEAVQACRDSFLDSIVKAIQGVSENEKSDPPPGVRDRADIGVLYGNKAVECVSVSYVTEDDTSLLKVTQCDLADGAHRVSIPDFVLEKIGEDADKIREIIKHFYHGVRGLRDSTEFDFNMRGAVIELRNVLDLSYEEAHILFRLFMTQYLTTD